MVSEINLSAKELIKECTEKLYDLYIEILKVFEDAKKVNPAQITNIRMILASLRNKEAKEDLERNKHKWNELFNIMKHYTEIKIKNNSKEGI